MKRDEIISTLYRIHEELTWVRDGLPYSMEGSDESSYLSTAMNMAWNLADAIANEDESDDETWEDRYVKYHTDWTLAKGRHRLRIGYRYLILQENGVIAVANYRGTLQGEKIWEGYKGYKFKNVTHFAWLPKSPKKDTDK